MVVETGGLYNQVQNTYDMLLAVIKKVLAVPDKMGLGVIYWEPQGEKSWSGYNLSCWSSGGKPTRALNAFMYDVSTDVKENPDDLPFHFYPNPSADGGFNVDLRGFAGTSFVKIYDLTGKLLTEQSFEYQDEVTLDPRLKPGIYLLVITNREKNYVQKLIVSR